ncbi:MAG: hypothetical protein CME64_10340 [Halobacteriovoraceae bacterium]|nr:hypothetical protein [Halobacteriovoraceae bacterium]|tara:strand:+ start:8761 stop:9132 length:372 start_codon:yes stop_codon:yes gene_type:complete
MGQNTPEVLANQWIKAIQGNSAKDMRLLIHPRCPSKAIKDEVINRMISGPFPKEYKVEVKKINASLDTLKKVYFVTPSKHLRLKYTTKTKKDRQKYGLGKTFPIALENEKWYFATCIRKQPNQ